MANSYTFYVWFHIYLYNQLSPYYVVFHALEHNSFNQNIFHCGKSGEGLKPSHVFFAGSLKENGNAFYTRVAKRETSVRSLLLSLHWGDFLLCHHIRKRGGGIFPMGSKVAIKPFPTLSGLQFRYNIINI